MELAGSVPKVCSSGVNEVPACCLEPVNANEALLLGTPGRPPLLMDGRKGAPGSLRGGGCCLLWDLTRGAARGVSDAGGGARFVLP